MKEFLSTRRALLIGVSVPVTIIVTIFVFLLFFKEEAHIENGGVAFVRGESVSEWTWEGPAILDDAWGVRVQDDIEKLSALVGTGEYNDYDIYVGLAGQYELLGDGARAYEYLTRAIEVDGTQGLAYHNLGHLLTRLGALHTARNVFLKAVETEPVFAQYHIAYLYHLTEHFSEDSSAITDAFLFGKESVQHGEIYIIYARWLSKMNRVQEAISVWQEARTLVSHTDMIDREILKLEARL